MIEFNKFYRLNGVLKKAQMTNPPVLSLPDSGLPFWSSLHYAASTKGVIGLQANHAAIRGLDKGSSIGVSFGKVDPALIPGKAIVKSIRLNEVISKYMRTVPGWKRNDFETSIIKYKENVMVNNYGVYTSTVTMQANAIADYNYFIGFMSNVIANIKNEIAGSRVEKNGKVTLERIRNHMIMIEVPDLLPSVKLLVKYAASNADAGKINALGNEQRWLIGELWKWLGGGQSVFSALSEEDMKYVNILFTRASSATLVNLYVLKNMGVDPNAVKNKKKTDEFIAGQSIGSYTQLNLQKVLLMMLSVMKTKVDSGIISQVLTEEELNGNGQAVADQENLDNLEAAILNDEDLDAPTEKAITQQFIADTTDTGENLESALVKQLRSKMGDRKGDSFEAAPTDELEDIFKDETAEDIDTVVNETLAILEELNDEAIDDPEEEEEGEQSFTTVETPEGYVTTPTGEVVEDDAFANVSYKAYEAESQNPEEVFMRQVMEEAKKGNISTAEVRRFEAISKKYRTTIKNPYGGEGTLAEAAHIAPEDLLIPENNRMTDKIPGVFNDSYLESSHIKMHRHYNTKILRKDIMANSLQLMKAGYAVDDYTVTTHNDVVDSYEIHTVRLVPIHGKPSTIKFRVPVVTANGTFKAGGNVNRMRVQRADIPIRKVKPGAVALTSYHSKMWVQRSPLVAFNYDKWVEKTITAAATNPEKLTISNVSYGDAFDNTISAPLMYTAISRYFTSFTIGKYNFMWDVKKNAKFFGDEVMKVANKYVNEQVLCGKGENSFIWMDYQGNLFEAPLADRAQAIPIGTIPELIGVDPIKIPVQSADLKIFSKSIPIGIALAFWVGLGNLLKTIGAKYRRVFGREMMHLQPNEFYVQFKNEKLVFDRNDQVTALIMSGWNEYHAFIKHYSVHDFDKKDTFGRFFYETKIEGRYENELTIIRQLWIDPITEGELIRLKEPTDMVMLFISAVKKLTYDKHPDPMDGLLQRDRGYERISGFVFDNMVRSVRGHRNRRFMKDAALDMPPEKVWYDILKDQTTGIAEFSNPIHSLKEQEVVVFRGAGGRSSQSMMADDRKAHRSNVGRDSEATVDSGDVATVLYTTANPNYDSVRGTIRYTDKPNENTSRSFGTSQLLAAAAEFDD